MAVYKDKNRTWYVSARYDNWQGEHARKVKRGFKTKKDAMEWERDFLLEKAGSLDMTFEAFVELYKTNLKERLKQSTWQTKISIIDNKILPYFRKKRITDIKVSDVVAWQNKLLNMADENGTRYSLVYLKTVHNQLSATLSHHMKILCDSGIVLGRKEGKWMYYSISAEGAKVAADCIKELTSAPKG